MTEDEYDLVIIGMGSGGLVAAEFAASLDLRVAAVERHRVGGDCLWTGCVPSKALIAAAKVAQTMRTAGRFGISSVEPSIDLAAVWKRIHAVQQTVANTDDNPDKLAAEGIEIVSGSGRLIDGNTVAVGERMLRTRFVMLCTGSRPYIPAIAGLADAGYLTSETLWDVDTVPASIVMLGGGPISIELAQSFNRLGIRTTVLQKGPGILPRDEPDLASAVAEKLRSEGVQLVLNVNADSVTVGAGGKVVHAGAQSWSAEELFVGAGRTPNIADLGLEDLGIAATAKGVEIDDRSRTSVKSVYAVGDIAGRALFTHTAAAEGVFAVRDMFFPGAGRPKELLSWCTFTDPELAHVGLTVAEAQEKFGADKVEVWRQDLVGSDRARADDATEGAIVVVLAKEKVVGAHILAPHAGETIGELALAVASGLGAKDLSNLVHIYPTYGTGIGQLAASAAFEKAQKYRWLLKRSRA